ncbi:TagK domain-containing protein [Paraburkholderia sediminicola]
MLSDAPYRRPEESAGIEDAQARGFSAAHDVRGARAVFGLIGASTASVAKSGDAAALDLIDLLHDQYRRALDDPQASFADGWTTPVVVASDTSGEPVDGQSSEETVEALLAGARSLEQAFGPLAKADAPDLAEAGPVPEILRLFATAEYHAAAARRSPALPPMLVRREHQALGIDSPLIAPLTSSSPEETV